MSSKLTRLWFDGYVEAMFSSFKIDTPPGATFECVLKAMEQNIPPHLKKDWDEMLPGARVLETQNAIARLVRKNLIASVKHDDIRYYFKPSPEKQKQIASERLSKKLARKRHDREWWATFNRVNKGKLNGTQDNSHQ